MVVTIHTPGMSALPSPLLGISSLLNLSSSTQLSLTHSFIPEVTWEEGAPDAHLVYFSLCFFSIEKTVKAGERGEERDETESLS